MNVWAPLLVGLLGSTHCVGMCGGLVAASRVPAPAKRRYLVRDARGWRIGLAQNAGRVAAYTAFGAVFGSLGGTLDASWGQSGRLVLSVLALGVLLLSAASLLGVMPARWSLERVGGVVWTRIAPGARRLLPLRRVRDALLFGALWGFLPCGIVYSALALAAACGSAAHGAWTMLAFGLGTTPAMLAVGQLADRLTGRRAWPRLAGVVVLAFAGLQLHTLVEAQRGPSVCCTSSVAASWAREQTP